MKKLILFAALIAFSSMAYAQVGLSVAPARLFVDANAKEKTQKIHLTNTAGGASSWTVYVQDWYRDSVGKKHFFPAGTLPGSCAAKVTVFPANITLDSGASADITVTISKDLAMTDQDTARTAMIVITQAKSMVIEKTKEKKATVNITTEFAVHLYLQNSNAAKNLEVKNYRMTGDSVKQLEICVANTGLLPLDSKVRMEITNKSTGKEWKPAEMASATLPGASRISMLKLPADLEKGNYIALAVVDSGESLPIKIAELDFELK